MMYIMLLTVDQIFRENLIRKMIRVKLKLREKMKNITLKTKRKRRSWKENGIDETGDQRQHFPINFMSTCKKFGDYILYT